MEGSPPSFLPLLSSSASNLASAASMFSLRRRRVWRGEPQYAMAGSRIAMNAKNSETAVEPRNAQCPMPSFPPSLAHEFVRVECWCLVDAMRPRI